MPRRKPPIAKEQWGPDFTIVPRWLHEMDLTRAEATLYALLGTLARMHEGEDRVVRVSNHHLAGYVSLAPRNVRSALSQLEARGLITRTGSEYSRGIKVHYPLMMEGGPNGPGGRTKRSPIKEGVKEEDITPQKPPKDDGRLSPTDDMLHLFPNAYQRHPGFASAWADWVAHRKEQGKALHRLPTTLKRQVKRLVDVGPVDAVAMLEHSTEAGYTGLYAPNTRQQWKQVPPRRQANKEVAKVAGRMCDLFSGLLGDLTAQDWQPLAQQWVDYMAPRWERMHDVRWVRGSVLDDWFGYVEEHYGGWPQLNPTALKVGGKIWRGWLADVLNEMELDIEGLV